MSNNLRSLIQLVALGAGLALLILVYMIERRTLAGDLMNAAIAAVPMVIAVGILIWDWRRPDRQPDFLRRMFGTYFDHEGFCFAIRPDAQNGLIFFNVFYQNRFERDSEAILELMPPRGFFLMRGKGVYIRVPLDVPGGAFGVVRIPLDLPDTVLGKSTRLDVMARVRYPTRRGRRLRFRPGLRVGMIEKPNWERLGLALNLLIAPTGSMAMSHPATMVVKFPPGPAGKPPEDFVLDPQILWRLGDKADAELPVMLQSPAASSAV